MIGQRWLPCPGFEATHEVSDGGEVRRIRTHAGHPVVRLLTPSPDTWGYPCVSLRRPGRKATKQVHRLVALAFLGAPPRGHEVNHVSGDKADSSLSNLEYVSHSVNMRHAFATGLNDGRGLKHRWPRLEVALDEYLAVQP